MTMAMTMTMTGVRTQHWSNSYVGLPWLDRGRTHEGIDCWGIIYLPYREVLGIEIPSYTENYTSAEEGKEIEILIGGQASDWPWYEIVAGNERPYDVVLMRYGAEVCHVGLVVNQSLMLHIERGGTSSIVDYREGRFRHRVIGFYRHGQQPQDVVR